MTVAKVCVVHGRHQPACLTTPDWHHLAPRDWQREWTAPGATVTTTAQYGAVWIPDGIHVCQNGHHNIHYWIVKLMRQVAVLRSDDAVAVRKAAGVPRTNEARIAWQALSLWRSNGGSLIALTDGQHWGQM